MARPVAISLYMNTVIEPRASNHDMKNKCKKKIDSDANNMNIKTKMNESSQQRAWKIDNVDDNYLEDKCNSYAALLQCWSSSNSRVA